MKTFLAISVATIMIILSITSAYCSAVGRVSSEKLNDVKKETIPAFKIITTL